MKILIIRFSSIGDIVLTTPVIRCTKLQTDADIHYLTKKKFKNILENNPYINKIWAIEKNISETLLELKAEHFDLIIDLHNNLRSREVSWRLGVKTTRFDKLNFEKWILVNLKINVLPKKHIVDRYMETVLKLNVKNDGKGLDYFFHERDKVNISQFTNNFTRTNEFIAFVIGAAHATKRLPDDKIIAICKKLESPVILIGGKEDADSGEKIHNACSENVLNLCGKLNLNQSASVVQQAVQVITHDTGLMHIAAAFNKDIISVWGNTVPEFGMTPYLSDKKFQEKSLNQIMEVKNLSCRPCSKIGFEACPKKHFKCMNLQEVEKF